MFTPQAMHMSTPVSEVEPDLPDDDSSAANGIPPSLLDPYDTGLPCLLTPSAA